jgi:prolyl-tRNA synthetase
VLSIADQNGRFVLSKLQFSNMAQLFRLQDRKGSEYLLAPTHEEEITALVSKDVISWRSLPVRVYQIGKPKKPS